MFSLHVKYRKQLQTETGSVSGPVLFTSCEMVYTDETQLYFSFQPDDPKLHISQTACLHLGMDERTSPTAQPSNQARFINNNPIKFTQKSFDDQLTFKDNIARTPQSGECALHNIRKIRPFLKEQAAQLLALVISRLNNENALLAGLPSCAIESLKMIQNTAG